MAMHIKHLLLCLAAMLISTSVLADKHYTLKVINHTQWTTNVITVLVSESEEPYKEVSRIPRHQSTEEIFTLAAQKGPYATSGLIQAQLSTEDVWEEVAQKYSCSKEEMKNYLYSDLRDIHLLFVLFETKIRNEQPLPFQL